MQKMYAKSNKQNENLSAKYLSAEYVCQTNIYQPNIYQPNIYQPNGIFKKPNENFRRQVGIASEVGCELIKSLHSKHANTRAAKQLGVRELLRPVSRKLFYRYKQQGVRSLE
jgi:hypothetical protein